MTSVLRLQERPALAAPLLDSDRDPRFAGLKVLIAHDWIVGWGGAERCIQQLLHVFPHADLVVGLLGNGMRPLNPVTRQARETWMRRLPGVRQRHRWFLPFEGLAFASLDTSGYDLIVSSSSAFAKAVRPRNGAIHVSYCHSPPRYLWDLRAMYERDATPLQRLAMRLGTGPLRSFDRRSANGVHHFISNSQYVSHRIGRCYGRTSTVIYPPVEPKPLEGTPGRRGDFLLYLGRLVPYKRVDLAILAAERLGVKLVIAGEGADRHRLERLAGRHTEFVGGVTDAEAGRLLETCRAFVFPAEEDFGIAPVEANAHGAPVIGYAAGGLLETMVPGVTSELFEAQRVDSLSVAIRRAYDRHWDEAALRANARRFTPVRYRRQVADFVWDRLQSEA
jgi:glycosyltransferase involved in cell wall biosynthesis